MTVQTDLNFNARAEALADQALAWIAKNRSIHAMDSGDETIVLTEYADCILYTQKPEGNGIKFGHLVMRSGHPRAANAAVKDFPTTDGSIQWVLCAVSDCTDSEMDELAQHVSNSTMVHEATHCLDFLRTVHRPEPFESSHMSELTSKYYNTPHEYNAFFHEGLYSFLRDIDLVKMRLKQIPQASTYRRKHLLRQLIANDSYWQVHFVNGLRGKYRRKFIRRCFRLFDELLPR